MNAHSFGRMFRALSLILAIVLVLALSACDMIQIGNPEGTTAARTDTPTLLPEETAAPPSDEPYQFPEAREAYSGSMRIVIDPRVELYMVLEYLSDNEMHNYLKTENENDYTRAVREHFSPFMELTTAKEFNKQYRIYGEEAFALTLSLDDGCIVDEDRYNELANAGQQFFKNRAADYAAMLREYAQKTDFNAFFERQAGLYEDMLSYYADIIPDNFDIAQVVEEFFGTALGDMTLYLSSLQGSLMHMLLEKSSVQGVPPDLFCLSPTMIYDADYAAFTDDIKEAERLAIENNVENLIGACVGAIYSDAYFSTNEVFIDTASRCELVYQVMMENSENMPDINSAQNRLLNDIGFIIRLRLGDKVLASSGEYTIYDSLQYLFDYGDVFAFEINNLLEYYEQNRDAYPTFAGYMPHLLDELQSIAEANLRSNKN